jgi:HEAT repeat protein
MVDAEDRSEDEATVPEGQSEGQPEGLPAAVGEVVLGEAAEGEEASPYGSLFVPLLVVPAMIVVVLLLVYTLVGAIAGEEASLEENLQRVMRGGANERDQAAFALVAQLAENDRALADGLEAPWEISMELRPNLVSALEVLGEDEAQLQYVISSALLHLGDPAGLEGLRGILTLGEEADPDGKLKFHALFCLGPRGDAETFEDVRPFLESDDAGLRSLAAGLMRYYAQDLAAPALSAALGDHDLAVRLNAAISLSWLGNSAGATLLMDGAGRALYEAERQRDPQAYARADVVRANRVRALDALARLGRAEDIAFFEGVVEAEDDLEVREAAMKALGAEK